MTISVTKPSINLREKLNELDQPQGLKGTELLRADTAQEVRNAISAGRKNLIINGAMQVAQRGTSSTGVTGSEYLLDRWRYESIGEETVSLTQSTDAPEGFANSKKVEVTTVDGNVTSTDYAGIVQRVEAQSLQHLKYGTSNAEAITMSFRVKSSVTGTYVVGIEHGETASYISATYTIDSANTWETKTVTFIGNTVTAIHNNNGIGLNFIFMLTAGSSWTTGSNDVWGYGTNWAAGQTADIIGTTSATFQITGVQLEVGSTATDFEHRSYGEELALCQRYFEVIYSDGNGEAIFSFDFNGSQNRIHWFYKVEKRAAPSFGLASGGSFSNSYTSIGSSVSRTQVYHSSPTFLQSSANTIAAYVDAEL